MSQSNGFNESGGGGESGGLDAILPLLGGLPRGRGLIPYVKTYSYLMMALAGIGVVVNLASLGILIRKKPCSMFHNLLKVRA